MYFLEHYCNVITMGLEENLFVTIFGQGQDVIAYQDTMIILPTFH